MIYIDLYLWYLRMNQTDPMTMMIITVSSTRLYNYYPNVGIDVKILSNSSDDVPDVYEKIFLFISGNDRWPIADDVQPTSIYA